MGLVVGSFTNKINRKFMLGLTMMLGGVTQFMSGSVNSFPFLCAMRVLHGSLNAATTPLSYSLVADYVPPEKRATANSILSSAIYLGISCSSLSILLIKSSGWRWTF
jgi:MFS family permease